MNLAFHYHQPAVSKGNRVYMTYFLGSFIDSIAPNFLSVTLFLHSPRASEKHELTYKLRSKNITLVNLGRRLPVYLRILRARHYRRIVKQHCTRIDVVLFRASTVLLPFIGECFPNRVIYFVSHSSKGGCIVRCMLHTRQHGALQPIPNFAIPSRAKAAKHRG